MTAAKGSPGASTAALALATCWPRRVLLAECDPAGGDIATGWLHGAADVGDRGLLSVALAARHGAAPVWDNVLTLDETGAVVWLPGLPDARQAPTVSAQWAAIADALAAGPPTDGADGAGEADVLADLGRLGAVHYPTAVATRADLTLLVVRSTLRGLAAARSWLPVLRADQPRVGVLLVGAGTPYDAGDVRSALGVDVVAVLADDPDTAGWLTGQAAHRPRHSGLLTSARTAARAVSERVSAGRDLPAVPAPAVEVPA